MTRHATPSELSLSQAAKKAGKSKSTINRAIKSGKLSATRHDDGTYTIAASELFRVFPSGPPTGPNWVEAQPPAEPDKATIIRIEALEAALQREREINADLVADRDHWRQQATALLSPPKKTKKWWPF